MTDINQLKYPIGRFSPPGVYTPQLLHEYIETIANLPTNLEIAVQNLDEVQLQTPYRPDGWTVQQLLHHIPDSHMNAYIRFKLALTEDNPTIKPYLEAKWAELPDTFNTPVNISLTLLHALHIRWVNLMKGMISTDWDKTVFHPEHKKENTLKHFAALYAWHSEHHLMHIIRLKERMHWK
jgi:DinB superfamily